MFACVTCHRGLRVDLAGTISESTLEDIRKQFNRLKTKSKDGQKEKEQEKEKDRLDPLGIIDVIEDSFVVLNREKDTPKEKEKDKEKDPAPSLSLDDQLNALTRLFSYFGSVLPVDFPICRSCADISTTDLDKKIKETQTEINKYKVDIQKLQQQQQFLTSQQQNIQNSINKTQADLQGSKEELEKRLDNIKQIRKSLQNELFSLSEEARALEEFENSYWKEYQQTQSQMEEINQDHIQIKQQIQIQRDLLEKLRRTSVYDDAFHISYDGHFGTINGFRMGRLPHQQVDWAETNAALGQVMLLLHTISKQVNFTFSKYKLIPLGSFSKMCRVDDLSTTYELYGSNELLLGKLFWYRRFDTALTWLLSCVREICDYAALTDPKFKIKYPMKGDMIGDCSIKLQFNNEAKWTKALKYLVTNLKFLLVWAAKRKE